MPRIVRIDGREKTVTSETLFQAASKSQPVSAAAALHLMQEGQLGDVRICVTAGLRFHSRFCLKLTLCRGRIEPTYEDLNLKGGIQSLRRAWLPAMLYGACAQFDREVAIPEHFQLAVREDRQY